MRGMQRWWVSSGREVQRGERGVVDARDSAKSPTASLSKLRHPSRERAVFDLASEMGTEAQALVSEFRGTSLFESGKD